MARVFVTRQLPGSALQRLVRAHEVEIWPGRLPPSPAELAAVAHGAAGLLTTVNDRVDAGLLTALPHLRVVANYAVGHDNIDLAAAARHGVVVSNTPDVLTDATADLTWALLLAAARQIVPAAENARSDWRTWEPRGFLGASVSGATLAVVGPGRIGRAVAARARGFDMTVRLVGRERHELEAALPVADFVSLHCPLTPETHHLMDAGTLALMRPTAILINTARGGIVDQVALLAALGGGHLAGAALDVTDPEPLPPEHPLLHTPGVLVTPHIGSATHAARARMADIAVDNLLAALAGEPLLHPVALPG